MVGDWERAHGEDDPVAAVDALLGVLLLVGAGTVARWVWRLARRG